jgi:N-glycosylase/DNA lyase
VDNHFGKYFSSNIFLIIFFIFNRWIEQTPNEFIGVLSSYIIYLKHENEYLYYTFYTNTSLNETLLPSDRQSETSLLLHNYFQLSIKLNDLYETWCKSDERFQNRQIPTGIRVLAQEPLENLISFICSSNNNVQRITKMIRSLCDEYGKNIGTLNEITYYQFPTIGIHSSGYIYIYLFLFR